MKPETDEWARKAENDWKVAQREMHSPGPVHDAVCFHAQQSAEKYLKAFLEEHGLGFARTHDLVVLLDRCAGGLPDLDLLRPRLAGLTAFGTTYRYPGADADEADAIEALAVAERTRELLRVALGIPAGP
jgi:HEPN domain-containing protein